MYLPYAYALLQSVRICCYGLTTAEYVDVPPPAIDYYFHWPLWVLVYLYGCWYTSMGVGIALHCIVYPLHCTTKVVDLYLNSVKNLQLY